MSCVSDHLMNISHIFTVLALFWSTSEKRRAALELLNALYVYQLVANYVHCQFAAGLSVYNVSLETFG